MQSLDLSLWNIDKMHISEIFSLYFNSDIRVRPLVFAVRKFSKVHQINDAFGGFVNSFAWTVAIVCYLMNTGLLPMFDLDKPPEMGKLDVMGEEKALGELLIGFFEWFLNWPIQTSRLTMRVPNGMCDKEADKFEDYTFVCIERPRTPFQNVTRQVEPKQWKIIKNLMSAALVKLKKDGSRVWDIL